MPRRPVLLSAVTAVFLVLSAGAGGQERPAPDDNRQAAPQTILPTDHPPVPDSVADYWFVPDTLVRRSAAVERLGRGIELIEQGRFAEGLPLVQAAELAKTPLANYAAYFEAVALIGLGRHADAGAILGPLADRGPKGYLAEAVPRGIAEAALGMNDPRRAIDVLDDLLDEKPLARDEVLLQLAQAYERAGDTTAALKAYREIYYDLPTSPKGVDAQDAIARLETADRIPPNRFELELGRAEKLFEARRWAQARAGFEPLGKVAQGDAAELVTLRLAECDYYLDRFRAARDRLRPLLEDARREAEARFFHLTATRALGDHATYVRLARELLADHPDGSWAEETLNNLATHYTVADDEAQADHVFRELMQRFPRSAHAERAAWKVGWRAYRAGDFRDAAQTFERAAAAFPRADYRPAWLYWSGRSRAQLDEPELAAERFRIAIADYGNSYYGRLATRALGARKELKRVSSVQTRRQPAAPGDVQTEQIIRDLIGRQLYGPALREVQYAQQQWGDSPRLQATAAYIRHNQGLELKAQERFTAIRGAINTMRRAYPQFMAAGGEHMPPDVLRIIFPLDYWPLITKYAEAHDLDPFLMAALMAQESTFTAEIRSSANAIGLMQLIPGTGRRVARQLGIRNFATSHLTRPETNVRIGMRYFKDLMVRFGGAHYALAGYNAGEHRVDRWIAERPPLPADEFIDDIPFPETQNYVKRILGTAEDYRYLYGSGLLDPNAPLAVASAGLPSASAPPAARSRSTVPASQRTTSTRTRR